MVEHVRHHQVPARAAPAASEDSGFGVHTEDILDGMEKVEAVAALVESAIIWRAQYIAWNVDIFKAESLLFRLIFKEGSQNPQAMDLLARIYFQQSKYEKARDLWTRALALQPGNPALRRTTMEMQRIAPSPVRAVLVHKFSMYLNCLLAILAICLLVMLGARGYDRLMQWAGGGSPTMENLAGRFSEHYNYVYNSITKDMEYVPSQSTVAAMEGELREAIVFGESPAPAVSRAFAEVGAAHNVGFTRKKVANGKEVGKIEVVVERVGNTLKASGKIPNLYIRYLVEEELWKIPGITELDLRGLVIDRTYRVNRGDSLWIIAKKLYGEGSSWTLLAKANDISDPNKLRIGQELILPLGDEILAGNNL
ncbi:MAG: LysM peptidoglycan-binding domain-containing protein [Synergistaceae bacterium]|nr:LysM peptidoglycan-binding domain-containing protein [Synergistaceae bacterium]